MGGSSRIRRVAIYGRVSTEHEAQLSAFENQQAWYEAEVQRHPDWSVVARYYDEGITGTAARKRPAFMQMRRDAKAGKFDLVVTREVCRFARNTVDTLTVTRELKDLGIEVYFIQDNIWTMDGDGELRLTIMATLAQEESRKISERVRAGQQISREKGVLYGTGNILGYERVGNSYVIHPEQAYVVRKIFDLYAHGMGYQRICAELTRLGCKNAYGQVSWKAERIGRILRNATYKTYGYECYRQKRTVSAHYLESNGLDASGVCQSKSIPAWQIDLMAKLVFQTVWKDRKEAVLLACEMIQDCVAQEEKQSGQIRDGLQAQLNRLEQKREGLRDMRALGDISREEFLRDTRKLEEAEMRLREQLQDLDAMQKQPANPVLNLEQIRATLEQWVDLSAPVVPEALVEQFILQVLLIDDNTFNWTLDLSSQTSSVQRRLKPSEIAFALYHRTKSNEVECLENTELERYILQPQEILSFSVTAQEAKAYCQSIGMRFFEKKWQDKTVTISIG